MVEIRNSSENLLFCFDNEKVRKKILPDSRNLHKPNKVR